MTTAPTRAKRSMSAGGLASRASGRLKSTGGWSITVNQSPGSRSENGVRRCGSVTANARRRFVHGKHFGASRKADRGESSTAHCARFATRAVRAVRTCRAARLAKQGISSKADYCPRLRSRSCRQHGRSGKRSEQSGSPCASELTRRAGPMSVATDATRGRSSPRW